MQSVVVSKRFLSPSPELHQVRRVKSRAVIKLGKQIIKKLPEAESSRYKTCDMNI
jgi:hypothetical protein